MIPGRAYARQPAAGATRGQASSDQPWRVCQGARDGATDIVAGQRADRLAIQVRFALCLRVDNRLPLALLVQLLNFLVHGRGTKERV